MREAAKPERRRRRIGTEYRFLFSLAALLAVLFYVAGGDANGPRQETADIPATAGAGQAASPQPIDEDEGFRVLAAGTWQDEYKGTRTMHLRPDGTGTMIVELSGLTAAMFASRLEFDMVWSIEDGRMKKQTVGGRPEGKVKAVLSMMGDRVDEPILELTEERLLLLDADGKTRYDWRRVANE